MFKKLENGRIELECGKITKEDYNQSLQSYLGLLKHCNGYKLSKEIKNIYY